LILALIVIDYIFIINYKFKQDLLCLDTAIHTIYNLYSFVYFKELSHVLSSRLTSGRLKLQCALGPKTNYELEANMGLHYKNLKPLPLFLG